MNNDDLPEHGGDIVDASRRYDIAIDQWIDLSTGINPECYPITLNESSFQQLPYTRPEFIDASAAYYQSSRFIPVSGTQTAIQQLPTLLADFPVLVPQVGYQEHVKYWREKDADIDYYPSLDLLASSVFIEKSLKDNPQQHLVIINPNNPTGVLFEKAQLLSWAKKLAPNAYLIVDEAFIDTVSAQSVIDENLPENIIVLRSFGKFFGLAGVRLGYCFAHEKILSGLQRCIGLWQVNGPAQAIAVKALGDVEWQRQIKCHIQKNALFTQQIFEPLMTAVSGTLKCSNTSLSFHSALFSSYRMFSVDAVKISQDFAESGILLRFIPLDNDQALLRIGLLDQDNVLAVKRVEKQVNMTLSWFVNTLCSNLSSCSTTE
jgi:cobalamin biosynthetic protein CobC